VEFAKLQKRFVKIGVMYIIARQIVGLITALNKRTRPRAPIASTHLALVFATPATVPATIPTAVATTVSAATGTSTGATAGASGFPTAGAGSRAAAQARARSG
jgi:hypothetical protein